MDKEFSQYDSRIDSDMDGFTYAGPDASNTDGKAYDYRIGSDSAEQGNSNTVTGTTVQVSVQMSPEFHISAPESQSGEDVMLVIRRHMREIADEIGCEIADRLGDVFENMSLEEA